MSSNIQLKGRPVVPTNASGQPAQLDSPAQVHNTLGPMPQEDYKTAQVLHGLSQLNPALQGAATALFGKQREDGIKAGKAAAETTTMAPTEVLSGAPIQGLDGQPEAYNDGFREAMYQGLAHRAALDIKSEMAKTYQEQKLNPDFDINKFLQENRQNALNGVNDEAAVATVGAHMAETEALIKNDWANIQTKKREEVRLTTIHKLSGDLLTPNQNADELAFNTTILEARGKELGFTGKEVAQIAFQKVTDAALRDPNKVDVEVFDMFEKKDPQGLSFVDKYPELTDNVRQAKAKALGMREKLIESQSQKTNAARYMDWEKELLNNPENFAQNPSRIINEISPHGLFKTDNEATAFYVKALKAVQEKGKDTDLIQAIKDGTFYTLNAEKQQKAFDLFFEKDMTRLRDAVVNNRQDEISGIASYMMSEQSRLRSSVPIGSLKRFVNTSITTLPNPDGPPPTFNAAAQLYRAMSSQAGFRGMYFEEDLSAIVSDYNEQIDAGADPKSAYMTAYQRSSPEMRRKALEVVKTPDFQKLLNKRIDKYAEGSSFWPTFLGGNGRPDNLIQMSADSQSAAMRFMNRYPYASESQLEAYVEKYTKDNWVVDSTTHMAIQVPPSLNGGNTQEFFTEFSDKLTKEFKLKERTDGEWKVRYHPLGDQGVYEAVAWNGSATQNLGIFNLANKLNDKRLEKVLKPDEKTQLSSLIESMQKGITPPNVDPKIVAKAQNVGALTASQVDKLNENNYRNFKARTGELKAFNLGTSVDLSSVAAFGGGSLIDKGLVSGSAEQFYYRSEATSNPVIATKNASYSLITMGEGASLKAYTDGAKGAGGSIGYGYNFKANSGTIATDFKAAGIPVERIEDIKAGKVFISPTQAQRLLTISADRAYETAKKNAPAGLWDKLTKQQQAVMVDIAYQAGSTVDFKKAWTALQNGDSKGFQSEVNTTFVDKTGNRVEDKRRNSLRAAMLQGNGMWSSVIGVVKGKPSEKLQALAEQ